MFWLKTRIIEGGKDHLRASRTRPRGGTSGFSYWHLVL